MLAALCFAMVFAISLASYVALCYTSLTVSTRSLMINHGTELSEAGIEQGLYALNNGDWNNAIWTASGTGMVASLTMTSAGLVATSSGPTPLNYGNGMNGTVTVTVANCPSGNATAYSTPAPTVTAQAFITLPDFAGSTVVPTVTQTVMYRASNGALSGGTPLFVNAVAAISGAVKFKSAGTVDSFSSNPAATSLVSGVSYTICTPGSTNWTSVGAANNSAGTTFTATGPGTGTGTAYAAYNPRATSLVSGVSYMICTPGTTNWTTVGASSNGSGTIFTATGPGTGTGTAFVESIAGYSGIILSQDVLSASATVRLMNATIHGYAVGYDYSNPSSTNWLSYSSGVLSGPNPPTGVTIDSSRMITEANPYQPIFLEKPTTGSPYSSASSLPMGAGGCSTDGSTLNQGSPAVGGTVLGNALATSGIPGRQWNLAQQQQHRHDQRAGRDHNVRGNHHHRYGRL